MLYDSGFAPLQILSGLPKLFLDVATEKEYSVIFTTPSGIQFGLQSLLLLILAGLLLLGFVGLAAWMTVRQLKTTNAAKQSQNPQPQQETAKLQAAQETQDAQESPETEANRAKQAPGEVQS